MPITGDRCFYPLSIIPVDASMRVHSIPLATPDDFFTQLQVLRAPQAFNNCSISALLRSASQRPFQEWQCGLQGYLHENKT